LQRLEHSLGEKTDRQKREGTASDGCRTDRAGLCPEIRELERELDNALSELRDNAAGRLVIGANESTTLYLLHHIENYRHMYPK
jgi:hypothetical protein